MHRTLAPEAVASIRSGANPFIAFIATVILALAAVGAARAQSAVDESPPAGIVPSHLTLTVTGSPATPAFLAAQIAAAIERATAPTLRPGSRVQVGTAVPALEPLDAGFLTTFTVPVTIAAGPKTLPVSGVTSIDLHNLASPGFAPERLFFNDDPERMTASGVLFRGTVDARHATRLYYYHENRLASRRLCIVLMADGNAPSRVQVIDTSAGPNADVMSVGHAVSRSFLTVKPQNEGIVVNVDAANPFIARDTAIDANEGIAGNIDVRVLSGGPVALTVMAIQPDSDPITNLDAPQLPADGHTRHGTFALAGFAQRIIAYTIGGPDAAIVYGTRARTLSNLEPTDAGRDYGDYGVVQDITFDIDNPSAIPQTVFLYEKPLGGVVRSSFLVDGTLADVGCVRVPVRYAVANTIVGPRTTTTLHVLTMTDGGSNYPLEIGVTPTQPVASAPPISAPDGCFPKRVPAPVR